LIRGGHIVSPVVEKATEVVTHGGTPYGLPLNAWKVIFQAILTFINVTCWLIPLKSKKMSENKLALSLANAFSGGVFLSLAFGHLLPECTHGFHDMNEAAPYMLALGGYMLIFFVEKIAFDAEHILHEATHGHGDVKGNGSMLTTDPSMAALSTGRGAIILLGALAVHSILEMTALGLADSFGDSALLTLSIALHQVCRCLPRSSISSGNFFASPIHILFTQPAESIALLVAFIKSGLSEGDIIKYLSIFSAMGPIGVALGMAVNEFAAPIVDAVMLAVVAGTFIYVGATEVIPEEFEEPDYKWKKFFALVSGIVSIFVITQYTMSLEAS
jgi:zinc transporter 1/2/3